MGIYPITSKGDHERALKRIEVLMDEEDPRGKEVGELDALVTLVEAYEEKHFPIPAPSPIATIEFMMDQRGLTRKDLEPMIGSRARVSEVLSGKRNLTLAMIRRLSEGLKVPADLLIEPSPKPAARSVKRTGIEGVGARLSPPEKKSLSLAHDRRNTYGENAKSSRKNIPRSKRLSQRAMRRAANVPLQTLRGNIDEDAAVNAELQSRTNGIGKDRIRFKKRPDKPLGDVLKRKASTSETSRKSFG